MKEKKIKPSGDMSVCIIFKNEISEDINKQVRAMDITIKKSGIEGIVETVPAYCSLTVHYLPEVIGYDAIEKKLESLLGQLDQVEIPPAIVVEIPVLYGGEAGPDLEYVSVYNHLTPDEVIRIHTESEYLIYMLGFTPGFTYLGGMNKKIATPRLSTPRLLIPGGSVGIAGEQTGIYPIDSPGGWQLIGRTPLKLYDPAREKPILLDAGQYIKFKSIGESEFSCIKELVDSGQYKCRITERKDE